VDAADSGRSCLASASCWATCLASTAAVYSLPKVRPVMATSSRIMLKAMQRSVRMRRISRDTISRWVSSWDALYCAITDLRVCGRRSGGGAEVRRRIRRDRRWAGGSVSRGRSATGSLGPGERLGGTLPPGNALPHSSRSQVRHIGARLVNERREDALSVVLPQAPVDLRQLGWVRPGEHPEAQVDRLEVAGPRC